MVSALQRITWIEDAPDIRTIGEISRLQAGIADIISGSKSLLRYLLKPVFRGFDTAFSER
jgi:hypothetical protein